MDVELDSQVALLEPPSARTHFLLAISCVLIILLLDLNPPLNRPWSNLYFLVAAYAAIWLRGPLEVLVHASIITCTIFVPMFFRPEYVPYGSPFFNRCTGIFYGLAMITLIRSRRRYVTALRESNGDLEQKVIERTSELQHEIAERQQIDAELRTSRQRLENLSRQLIAAQEVERRSLARELHDQIGQVLTAVKLNVRRAQKEAGYSLQPCLESTAGIVDELIGRVRSLSLNLRPPQLDELGLGAALHWLVKHHSADRADQNQLDVELGDTQIPAELEIVCFRIAQEAVTNALRHAQFQHLNVTLNVTANQLHLIIEDDGVGFNVNDRCRQSVEGESLGLISMQERAGLAGGHIEINSTPAHGTKVHAVFPLPHLE